VGTTLAIGSLSTAAATLIVLAVVAHAIGSAAAGSLRGASSAMGPVNVLIAFTALSLTQVLARRRRELDIRFCAWVAAVMLLLTLCWGAVLLLLPEAGGSALFGESWPGIRRVLPWTLVEYVAIVTGTAAVLGLKVRGQARAIIVQDSTAAIVAVTGGCVAALAVAATPAVAAALAFAAAAAATMGWVQLTLSRPPDAEAHPTRRTDRGSSSDTSDGSTLSSVPCPARRRVHPLPEEASRMSVIGRSSRSSRRSVAVSWSLT